MTEQELKAYGLRWCKEERLSLPGGETVTVKPSTYLRRRETSAPDKRTQKCLRLYSVHFVATGEDREMSELDIEKMLVP
jgi:hypothetical protein